MLGTTLAALLCLLWLAQPDVTVFAPAPPDLSGAAPLPANLPPAPSATLSTPFAGAWGGTVVQVEPEMVYPVLVLLTESGESRLAGFVDYPSFPCGGPAVLLAAAERQVDLVEQMDYGNAYCVDNGQVRLSRRPDGMLDYSWVAAGAAPGSPATVTGVLKRRTTLADAG